MLQKSALIFTLIFQLLITPSWAIGNIEEVDSSFGKAPTAFFYDFYHAMSALKSPVKNSVRIILGKSEEEILSHNINAFQEATIVSRKLQVFGNSFGTDLIAKIRGNTAVDGYSVHQLSGLLRSYHMVTSKLLQFSSMAGSQEESKFERSTRFSDRKITKRHLLWLAANVVIFDILMDANEVYYQGNGRLRRITKEVEKSNTEIYEQFIDQLKYILTPQNRNILEKNLRAYQSELPLLRQMAATDVELAQLINILTETKATNKILTNKSYYAKSYALIDGLITFVDKVLSLLAQYFSDLTKFFSWRQGYLYENDEAQKHLQSRLKPLDILLTKSPFSLTDYFIPGFTTHAAMYVGNEKLLKEHGLWNHPSIVPYHDQIRNGKEVIEAVRYGVLYHTFKKFSETDQIIVIRSKQAHSSKLNLEEALERLTSLIGKKYDYSFDVEGIGKVVCSEVVYHAHGDITWPTKRHLGRFTISPDDLASLMYYDNSPVELVAYVAADKNLRDYKEISKKELGVHLGFEKNESRSLINGYESYDKKVTKCRTITRKSSIGKRNKRLRTRRVCTTEYQAYDYLDLLVD